MQKGRPYSNSKESDPPGPSKSYTAKIIMLRDKLKVNSLLSDSAEKGKLTHLLEILQTLEMLASFSRLLHYPSGKKQNQKAPKGSHLPNREMSNNKTVQETRKSF